MKKWMRKSTINFLERNKDVIAAPGFVPLCNKMIVDVMATGFEVVARDTHFITCRARQILTENLTGDVFQEDDLLKAEKELHAHLDGIHDYFDTRLIGIEQLHRAMDLGRGVRMLVALEAVSDPDPKGMRTVMTILNGTLRPVQVRDRSIEAEATPRRTRGVTRKAERTPIRKMRERFVADRGPAS